MFSSTIRTTFTTASIPSGIVAIYPSASRHTSRSAACPSDARAMTLSRFSHSAASLAMKVRKFEKKCFIEYIPQFMCVFRAWGEKFIAKNFSLEQEVVMKTTDKTFVIHHFLTNNGAANSSSFLSLLALFSYTHTGSITISLLKLLCVFVSFGHNYFYSFSLVFIFFRFRMSNLKCMHFKEHSFINNNREGKRKRKKRFIHDLEIWSKRDA